MIINKETRIWDIASTYPGTVSVFVKYDIDFCCKGYKSLEITAEEFSLKVEDLIEEINEAVKAQEENKDFDTNVWLDKVCEKLKHMDEEIIESIIELEFFAKKVATVHWWHTPSLIEIKDITLQLTEAVTDHLSREHDSIHSSAFILAKAKEDWKKIDLWENLESQTVRFEQEHFSFWILLDQLTKLTNDFTTPDDACNSYKILFAKLKEFKISVMKHANIVNYTVHPQILKLEKELSENWKVSTWESCGGCGCGSSCS